MFTPCAAPLCRQHGSRIAVKGLCNCAVGCLKSFRSFETSQCDNLMSNLGLKFAHECSPTQMYIFHMHHVYMAS